MSKACKLPVAARHGLASHPFQTAQRLQCSRSSISEVLLLESRSSLNSLPVLTLGNGKTSTTRSTREVMDGSRAQLLLPVVAAPLPHTIGLTTPLEATLAPR